MPTLVQSHHHCLTLIPYTDLPAATAIRGTPDCAIWPCGRGTPAYRCYTGGFAVLRGRSIIYPGSFDPPTNGHLDLIERAAAQFDAVVVAVLKNEEKSALFSVSERIEMLSEALKEHENVEIDSFEGLLVDYARQREAHMILRGIRAVSDYEYELQMALMNRHLMPELETIFMLPGEAYSYISSRLVKEVASLGGNITELVPPNVARRLREHAAE